MFMWFAGLRGAMAFTLAINLPAPISAEVEQAFFTTTLIIAVFTVIVQGAFILPVLDKLKIPMAGAGFSVSITCLRH
jgi:NhaP-type Na+/H+ or K+/H+ antiporter